ncbi:type II 3-dehydroquinate dehydratase [Bergeyella sp. RCAD1439]|uniref:type II 3-dehydroquinate dehydratase n=1 Tax=Bergeyella anatis TaxID=3113737 RepID=UPI002E186A53|nr:type II 3-dehydroquinate dehydratase [Bergeyella sp. RCAD1439]
MKLLIVNGPNLNLLGTREPEIYGTVSMTDVLSALKDEFAQTATIDYFQSNHEGALIDRLQDTDYDALIINPGAFTHYSYALADCLKNILCPKVEVHISPIYKREPFRQKSVTAPHTDAVLSGFGVEGYRLAAIYLTKNTLQNTVK